MSGLVALNGGREHTPGCEVIDRALLTQAGGVRPRVTVLLAATRAGRLAFKVAEAQAYWRPFRVDLQIGFTGRPDDHDHALALLESPDLVVLTGGFPWLLHQRLKGTVVLDRILELSSQGVPLSGSSAGAMALCEWQHELRPPRPLRLFRAFGLVQGAAAAPHFEHFDMNQITRQIVRLQPQLIGLGLPNRTALVGQDGEYRVLGAGPVSVIRSGRQDQFLPGQLFSLTSGV